MGEASQSHGLHAPERLSADMRASEVADAIGLGYRHSRATLKRILMGEQREIAPPAFLEQKMKMGQMHEELAEAAFQEVTGHVIERAQTTIYKKDFPFAGAVLAATPDLETEELTVELKCTEKEVNRDQVLKEAHIAQCLAQMICANKTKGALMYYSISTGNCAIYWLHRTAKATEALRTWLTEFLRLPPGNLRMPPGEKARRENLLFFEVYESNEERHMPKKRRME